LPPCFFSIVSELFRVSLQYNEEKQIKIKHIK